MLYFLCGNAVDVKGVHLIFQNSHLDARKIFYKCRSSAQRSLSVTLMHGQ
jgi:hypothetical protein